MIVQNPDSLATEALQVAQSARDAANGAQNTANQAQNTANQAQNTANAAAKSYSQIDLSSLSIEQLWQRGQKNNVDVGALSWNSAIAPTATNYFLLLGNWGVMALGMDGGIYRIDQNTHRWVKISPNT